MSDIPSSSEFLNIVKPDDNKNYFKIGTVSELFANGTAKIIFDGEELASEKQYSYLNNYKPSVGDRVLMASVSSTYIVLGKLGYNASPNTNISPGNVAVSGSLTVSGYVGFFGGTAHNKTSVNYPASIQTNDTADTTYSTNEVTMLGHLKTDVTNLRDTVNNLVAALKGYNLI